MPITMIEAVFKPPYKHVRKGMFLKVTTPTFIAYADEVLHAMESLPEVLSPKEVTDEHINGVAWSVDVDAVDPGTLTDEQLESHILEVARQLNHLRRIDVDLTDYYAGFAEEVMRIIDGIAARRDALEDFYEGFASMQSAIHARRAARIAHLEKLLADATDEQNERRPITAMNAREIRAALAALKEEAR